MIQLFFRLFYPKAIRHFPNEKGKLFLTFDDGPAPLVTPLILDILKNFNAKATFFCLGGKVEKYPEIFNRIIAEGHSVGNHTYNHINGLKYKFNNYCENIDKAGSLIDSDLFRPPYGKMSLAQYKFLAKKYKIILWDVVSYDYDEKTGADECVQNVIKHVKDGSIILFHDAVYAKDNVLKALPIVLEYFGKLKYSFEPISISI